MQVPETVRALGAGLFEIDPNSLSAMEATDSVVFSCRRGSQACVMKFVPEAGEGLNALEEQLKFIRYLGENGVQLALPLASIHGRDVERVTDPGDGQAYLLVVKPYIRGRSPLPRNPYDWTERLFSAWGQVIGRMHALARQYPHWERQPGTPGCLFDWSSELDDMISMCEEPKIAAKMAALREPLSKLPRSREDYGLIHNDLHMFNFFYNPDARAGSPITIIDYDVCGYHWFINDIGIALYHAMTTGPNRALPEREAFARVFLKPFLQGYEKEYHLDPAWLEHLPLFMRYREVLIYIALTKSWPEAHRSRWQQDFLAHKRSRILRDEPLVRSI